MAPRDGQRGKDYARSRRCSVFLFAIGGRRDQPAGRSVGRPSKTAAPSPLRQRQRCRTLNKATLQLQTQTKTQTQTQTPRLPLVERWLNVNCAARRPANSASRCYLPKWVRDSITVRRESPSAQLASRASTPLGSSGGSTGGKWAPLAASKLCPARNRRLPADLNTMPASSCCCAAAVAAFSASAASSAASARCRRLLKSSLLLLLLI